MTGVLLPFGQPYLERNILKGRSTRHAAGTAAAARKPAVQVKLGRAARQRSARHALAERTTGRGLQRMARDGLAGRPAQKNKTSQALKKLLALMPFLCTFAVSMHS